MRWSPRWRRPGRQPNSVLARLRRSKNNKGKKPLSFREGDTAHPGYRGHFLSVLPMIMFSPVGQEPSMAGG